MTFGSIRVSLWSRAGRKSTADAPILDSTMWLFFWSWQQRISNTKDTTTWSESLRMTASRRRCPRLQRFYASLSRIRSNASTKTSTCNTTQGKWVNIAEKLVPYPHLRSAMGTSSQGGEHRRRTRRPHGELLQSTDLSKCSLHSPPPGNSSFA